MRDRRLKSNYFIVSVSDDDLLAIKSVFHKKCQCNEDYVNWFLWLAINELIKEGKLYDR